MKKQTSPYAIIAVAAETNSTARKATQPMSSVVPHLESLMHSLSSSVTTIATHAHPILTQQQQLPEEARGNDASVMCAGVGEYTLCNYISPSFVIQL